ncbi:MAG: glycosyltransferase family 9 protein [Nanoarchaeota archaeon]
MHIPLIRTLDKTTGSLASLGLGLFPKRKPKKPKSILAIQLWGLGETVLTLPALRALQELYPKAKIDILCTDRNKDVYVQQPYNVHPITLEPANILSFIRAHLQHYDLVVDFEEYLRSAAVIARLTGKYAIGFRTNVRGEALDRSIAYVDGQHTAECFLDLIRALSAKIPRIKTLLPIKVSKDDEKGAAAFLKKYKVRSFIGIAPGAAETSKQRIWPLERFAQIADSWAKTTPVILFGGEGDRAVIDRVVKLMKRKAIVASGELSLRESIAALSKAKLVLANDAGFMHVAAAQGVKTIGLFGPNLPIRWKPLNEKSIAVYEGYSCSPCINSHKGEFPACKFGKDNRCMKKISVEEVFNVGKKMMER